METAPGSSKRCSQYARVRVSLGIIGKSRAKRVKGKHGKGNARAKHPTAKGPIAKGASEPAASDGSLESGNKKRKVATPQTSAAAGAPPRQLKMDKSNIKSP